MSDLVIFVILGSAIFHAAWNAVIKGGTNTLYETVLKTSGGGILSACLLLFIPAPAPESWPYLAGTVCIHIGYYLCLAYAYRGADLGYAYTLMRGTSPLLTALMTVLVLGHSLPLGGWAGVLCISLGILSLTTDSIRRGNFNWRVTLVALANAVVIMGYTVVDGSGVRLSGNALSYTCWVFFLNAFPLLFVTLFLRRGEYLRYAQKRWRYGLFGGACSFIAYGLSLWGMARAPISLVAALRETSIIFGMLLGIVFLGEKITGSRVLAVVLVAAGAIVIKVWGK